MTGSSDPSVLRAYVEAELSSAWLRKASFETRAFSVVTMNLGIITLFFALQTQTGLSKDSYEGLWRTIIVIAIAFAIISIITAALSALPLNYPTPEYGALDDLFSELGTSSAEEQGVEILEARIFQLKQTIESNRIKARFILASFVFFCAATAFLTVSLGRALICSQN